MNISKYIYDYLIEYNTPVVVPDLGCFTIVNIPSEIQDGKVIPPFKTVKLDSENSSDDSVLTSYLARKENITIEQAAEEIRKFYVQNFISRLPIKKIIVFEKFGTFSLSETNDIVFTPDPEFFNDNYGLDYAFFSDNTIQQPQEAPVTPEPEPVFVPVPEPIIIPEPIIVPKSEPIFAPEPEPIFVPKPEPISAPEPEPVLVSEPVQTPPEKPLPKPESGLFDMNDSSRFRENTARTKRSSMDEKKEPHVKPAHKAKTPPAPKKPKQKTKTNSSNMWVLWVLLAAAGLGVIGYYLSPKVYPMLFSRNTTITTLVDIEQEPVDTDEPEADIPNTELTHILDDVTDKKIALNPEAGRQTEIPTSQSQTSAQSSPPKTESIPPPSSNTQSQGNVGQGRYVLIVGSFETRASAERFCKKLQTEGISYEIIVATVNGAQWNRVSIAGFDTLDEAVQQVNQMKSKPYCQDVWVAKR